MIVSYEVTMAEPEREFLQVRYTNADGQEYWKNLIQTDWSAEGIERDITAYGPEIVAYWERVKGRDNTAMAASVKTAGEFECEPWKYVVDDPAMPQIRPEPEYDPFTQRIEQDVWELGDEWIEWKVINLSPEEQADFYEAACDGLRHQRNAYLQMSDWIFTPDSTPKDMDAWLNYRQQLRDITESEDFPRNVRWPVAPEAKQ